MFKRHAVLLTVLFSLVLTLTSVSVIFWEFYKLNQQQYIDHIFTKYSVIIQIYKENQQRQNSDVMLEANLAVYKLFLIKEEEEAKKILRDAIVLKEQGIKSLKSTIMLGPEGLYRKNTVGQLDTFMLQKDKIIYFKIDTPVGSILVKDEALKPYSFLNLMYAYSTIFTIITLSFLLILQKLRPLIRLRKKIALFGDGNMQVSFKTKNSDEIGLVSNELESAREKIQNLLNSRTLFLRNIMHELKTPIAKGTIATQMLDSQKQRDRFTSIFSRLESLVNEFALIEEVTSLDDKSEFIECRLLDIIDGAIDMAMVDTRHVSVEVSGDVKVNANYRLYTTAIKNMIDNAMKYSPDAHIKIVMINSELSFESKGERLAHPLQFYIEPFTKENPSKNSFGLGLYLVDSILKAHDQVLAYEYEEGLNRFIFV
jgi:two-component system OmpR family sensor kinase